jgi:hypothetical protein
VPEQIGRVVASLLVIVGLPLACLAGVALYGRALSEADVGIGTLVPPEVAQRRFAEARARFVAMSPAEHLAAARAELATDPSGRRYGHVGLALEHLAAIPPEAPEQREADALRAELARRRREALRAVAARVELRIREQGDPAGIDPGQLAARRAALARALAGRPPEGVGGVAVEGDGGVTLRLDRRRCDPATLDAVILPPSAAALRAMGFRAVRCGNDAGVLAL